MGDTFWKIDIDSEITQFLVETNLPNPIWQGRTVNLLEGKWWLCDQYILIGGFNRFS